MDVNMELLTQTTLQDPPSLPLSLWERARVRALFTFSNRGIVMRKTLITTFLLTVSIATANCAELTAPAKQDAKPTSPHKKPITFELVDGEERPICQQYLEMLKATKYTELPACERKILPQFPQFKAIDWTEITDKQEIEKIMEENIKIEFALMEKLETDFYKSEWMEYRKNIRDNKLKLYSYKSDFDKDDEEDTVYKATQNIPDLEQFMQCKKYNHFYIKNKKLTLENIAIKKLHSYFLLNLDGSSELFSFNKDIYVSTWAGKIISAGSNLDIYAVGNKKLCGILVK
jgi:hypothetical protein